MSHQLQRMKIGTLIEVDWVDSAFHHGWSRADTKRQEMGISKCRTVGYFISADKVRVSLASSTADKGESYADGISIPRVAVKTIRRLR